MTNPDVNPTLPDIFSSLYLQVLGRIKDAAGKHVEVLIGIASQTCNAMSAKHIAPVLDSFDVDEAFAGC